VIIVIPSNNAPKALGVSYFESRERDCDRIQPLFNLRNMKRIPGDFELDIDVSPPSNVVTIGTVQDRAQTILRCCRCSISS
jgi:hypothetical protein